MKPQLPAFRFSLALASAVLLANAGSLSAEEALPMALKPAYPNLAVERPVALLVPPDGTQRRFLVEQTGSIKILPADEDAAEAALFLDLRDRMQVDKDFEEGLLGMAFHPGYAENGRFYLYYSKQGPKRSVLSEFQVADGAPGSADPASERVLMEIIQPEWNHNSGNLLFGPEGYLYVCVGDGGLKNGVFMLSQKLSHFNGKILRIDVDGRSPGLEYGIPGDNPFVGEPHACEEIWALGLRNPWGAAIDPETGLFWVADVGQDLYEEINLIVKGGNYGWEYREGLHEFAARGLLMDALGMSGRKDPPRGVEFIDPIHEYPHGDGLSITGGFVYRGSELPALAGKYLYGDWKYGTIWALEYDAEAAKTKANHALHKADNPAEPTVQPTGFYPDENGEPFVLCWQGKLMRLAAP